jgi:hypothetical protein
MKTLLLLIFYVTSAAGFCPILPSISHHRASFASSLNLVTEADVLALVEKAEVLWDEALEARKRANSLSEKAESLGLSAETSASSSSEALQSSISIGKIADAQEAQNLAVDLGALLEEVKEAEERADEIEGRAEMALEESERALEQHLIDFPENA